VDEYNRVCFALASYNAGYGHLYEARQLADDLGALPERLGANVEEARKLLSNPKYASKARYGYCKATETINYVRDITTRYKHYSDRADAKTRRDIVGTPSK
jgi:membrane-bound lytic murein transglycosylase F